MYIQRGQILVSRDNNRYPTKILATGLLQFHTTSNHGDIPSISNHCWIQQSDQYENTTNLLVIKSTIQRIDEFIIQPIIDLVCHNTSSSWTLQRSIKLSSSEHVEWTPPGSNNTLYSTSDSMLYKQVAPNFEQFLVVEFSSLYPSNHFQRNSNCDWYFTHLKREEQ